MHIFLRRCLLLNSIWRISGASAEAFYGPPISTPVVPWPGHPSYLPQFPTCTSTTITVIETSTITRPGAITTVIATSISSSGTVLNTTQTATSSALDKRYWGPQSETEVWTHYWGPGYCTDTTFVVTSTAYVTDVLPDSTVTETTVKVVPAKTLSCSEGCKLDVTATKLVYPQSVVHVTVPVTVDSMPEPHTPDVLTWVQYGVTLTYPTTYLFYSEMSHAYLASTDTKIATTCPTASASLTLPSPTNFAPLIFPQEETPGPDLPPTALISYLNGVETVLVQLSGTPIGSSCDPVGGGIVEPVSVPQTGPPQVLFTSTYILASATSTTSTTKTVVAITGATSTSMLTMSSSSATGTDTFSSTGTSTVTIYSESSTPTTSTTKTIVAVIGANSASISTSSSYSITGAATFESTGTATVVLYSANSTSYSAQQVAVNKAQRRSEMEKGWVLGLAGMIWAWA